MPLSIQGLNDFIKAHEITDEWQILTIACLIRVCECAGHDVPEFVDVAHMNDPPSRIKRKSPAHGSVCLLLRSHDARKILVVERRDDECMVRKPGFLHWPIDLRFAGKVGNVEFAAADRFYIRQRGPDKVFDSGIFGGAYRHCCLLELVASCFPKIRYQENSVCPCKCSFECLRFV